MIVIVTITIAFARMKITKMKKIVMITKTRFIKIIMLRAIMKIRIIKIKMIVMVIKNQGQ